MEEFLAGMVGKRLEVFCGGSSALRGKVLKVEKGVLHLADEDESKTFYVAIERIIAVGEAQENEQRAGFLSSAGFLSGKSK